jgi:hypothetical protein
MITKIITLSLIYIYFCLDHLSLFKRVKRFSDTNKQDSIIAIRANLILTCISTYYIYRFLSII